MNTIRTHGATMLIVLLFLVASHPGFAQGHIQSVAQDGFTLTKIVSETSVPSGQTFVYNLQFSMPGGTQEATLTDNLPPALEIVSVDLSGISCAPATTTIPPAGSMGGQLIIHWGSLPAGCSGHIKVLVRFPNGTTCDGAGARNFCSMNALIEKVPITLTTGSVSTTAIVRDPWVIHKNVIGTSHRGGPCPNVTADEEVLYELCVAREGALLGSYNLYHPAVTDVLPQGAEFLSASCTGVSYDAGTQTISWGLPPMLVTDYNMQCCTIRVRYPRTLFPLNTQVTNMATLTGDLGSATAPCGTAVHQSNTTCVEFLEAFIGSFGKSVTTSGQPGCTGQYTIKFCNNGTVPLTSFTITDPVPNDVVVTNATVSSGLTTPTITGNLVSCAGSTPLLPTQCVILTIAFTINPGALPNTLVHNCATVNSPQLPAPVERCGDFIVTLPAPKLCVQKQACEYGPFHPGQVVRYRLRFQNVGGVAIQAGALVTDHLDEDLELVGNGTQSSYSSMQANPPCQPATTWSVPPLVYTQNNHTVQFTLPEIPAVSCRGNYYPYCGMYPEGTVAYYFIEFSVRIKDSAAIGSIRNRFLVAGANLTGGLESNLLTIQVVGGPAFKTRKEISLDNTTWGSSLNLPPGAELFMRLSLINDANGAPLKHVTFVDLLPMDNLAGPAPLDKRILGPCFSDRGSHASLTFISSLSTLPSAQLHSNPATSAMAAVVPFQPTGSPLGVFVNPNQCGTAGAWSLGSPTKNLGYYFGNAPIGANQSAMSRFKVRIDAQAQPRDKICNTFAAGALLKYRVTGGNPYWVPAGALENASADVCVTIDSAHVLDTICGHKFNDLNNDGKTDTDDPPLSGWQFHLLDAQGHLVATTTTGNNGMFCFPPVGPGTYTIHEVPQSGWTQTSPGGTGYWTVTIPRGPDSTGHFFDFWNHQAADTCDILDGLHLDTDCCTLTGTILNLLQTPITSIHYAVTGAIVDVLTTIPNSSLPGTPPPGHGTTSGMMTFTPPAPGNVQFSLSLTPTTSSGIFTLQFYVIHGGPGHPQDTCWISITDTCQGSQTMRCDSLAVSPWSYNTIHESNRLFRIFNLKIPFSPICKVLTNLSPSPASFSGGSLTWDGTLVPNGVFVWPYQVAMVTPPAMNTVSFHLAVNNTIQWSGHVTITVIHCDGDTCHFTPIWWEATPPCEGPLCPVLILPEVEDPPSTLTARQLRIDNRKGGKSVKWVGITPVDAADRIFAISGTTLLGGEKEPTSAHLENAWQSSTSAMFAFAMPVPSGQLSGVFHIVVNRSPGRIGTPVVRWTTYDETGAAISTDTIAVGGPVSSIRSEGSSLTPESFQLLDIHPNPAREVTSINYVLERDATVRVEIWNDLGIRVASLDQGRKESGIHTLRTSTSSLAPGTYWIRLLVAGRYASLPLVILR